MRVARWKVMAGGLLLSAGGLMAVADGPNPPGITLPGCQPAPAVLPVAYLSPPVAVPAPKVAELPPAPPALPPLPTVTAVRPQPVPAAPAVPSLPAPSDTRPAPLTGFKLDTGAVIPAPVAAVPPMPAATAKPAPAPFHLPEPVADRWSEVGAVGLAPAVAVVAPPAPIPTPAPAVSPLEPSIRPIDTKPLPGPEAVAPVVQPVASPAPAVPAEKPLVTAADRPERIPTPTAAERRLKVVLHMGDDRPRFEVRDGDETYLKVVSDRVEVKSAADKADAATMKAGGKVAFVTPGGDGTCDELTILPGSGQVVATGNVSFRHTWGRSETTVTAERMTFRLAHPGPTAIQAGYTPIK